MGMTMKRKRLAVGQRFKVARAWCGPCNLSLANCDTGARNAQWLECPHCHRPAEVLAWSERVMMGTIAAPRWHGSEPKKGGR